MRAAWSLVLAAAVVVLLMVGGCGGHDGQVPPGPGPGPDGATFVGKAVCAVCHEGPAGAFEGSPHGKNFKDPASNGAHADLINGMGGACAPCHVTGYQEPSGWTSSVATPQLDGISCEECHGAGGKHAGQPGSSNITKVPSDKACWDCHVPSYKFLDKEPPITNDAALAGMIPGKMSLHYRQTPFLLGYLGFDRAQMEGPHAQVDNTCVTCHLNAKSERKHGSTGLAADFQACAACHGSAEAGQALAEEFLAEIKADLIAIGGENPSAPGEPDPSGSGGQLAAFATAHAIDLAANSNPTDPDVRAYKAAKYNYLYILGGNPVHNPPFAEKLVEDSKRLLK